MMFGGAGGGGGRGGGGGGGRRMIRFVGRAVTSCSVGSVCGTNASVSSSSNSASSHKLKSSSSDNNNNIINPVSLSYSSSLSSTHSNYLLNGFPFWLSDTPDDYSDWDFVHNVDGTQEQNDDVSHVFSPVPSETEVDAALSALHQVFGPGLHSQFGRDKSNYKLDNELDYVSIPSDVSETDWKEPSLFPYNSEVLQADGSDRVHYAFHLLQTEPYVKRVVKSLSSDKAVWDAVLNNEAVRELRELRESMSADVFQNPDGTHNSDSCATTNVVMWILDAAKAKFMEVIVIIRKVLIKLFQPADHKTAADAEGTDPINDNLRSAFMLSIMVLLIVVVSRADARACHNLTT